MMMLIFWCVEFLWVLVWLHQLASLYLFQNIHSCLEQLQDANSDVVDLNVVLGQDQGLVTAQGQTRLGITAEESNLGVHPDTLVS